MKKRILVAILLAGGLCGCVSSPRLNSQKSSNVRSYVDRQTHRPDTTIMVVPATDVAAYMPRQAPPPSVIEMPGDEPASAGRERGTANAQAAAASYRSVRTPEQVVSYRIGREEDRDDANLMHEAHDVYQVVGEPSWVLSAPIGVQEMATDGRSELQGYSETELAPRLAHLEERSRMAEEADEILIDSVKDLQSALVMLANEISELKGEKPLVPAAENAEKAEAKKQDKKEGQGNGQN